MSVVFLSHSSEDRALAEDTATRLRGQGWSALFLDLDPADGIAAGRPWERELYAALRRSDGLVFLATAASVRSRWCFAEVALARSLAIPVFGVRASAGAELDLLDDVQWVDLAEGEVAYERLWAGMRAARLDPAQSQSWDATRSPYPGLRSFSAADAAVFFGRAEETRHLAELVQPTILRGSGRWITIVGPSGSGKSSLLCAGLLPALARAPEHWVVVPTFAPGPRPTHQLALALHRALAAAGLPRPAADLERRLTDPATGSAALVEVARDLSDTATGTRPRVLVAVDQAEEVITRAGPREQQAFLRLLKEATGQDSPLWVVCTLRSEYLSTAPERAGLSEVTDDAVVLEPLSRNRLAEVIARPARRAGIDFEPGLVERMVEDTTGGDALPLLAHTLYELAQAAAEDRQTQIRSTDYELLGGVVGALQRRADQLLTELVARGHDRDVLPTLLGLVTLDQDGQAVRRRVPRSSLSARELEVVEAFVDARLLTSDRGAGDADATVEVTHEALLRRWSPLQQAIEDARSSLRMRSELEREAADWNAGRREESYLLRGARLAAFREWVAREEVRLAPLEAQFLAASGALASRELEAVQRSNRRLKLLLGGVAALLVVAVVAGAVAVDNRQEAEAQSALALTRQLMAQADALRSSQPDAALLLGVEAVRRAPDSLDRDARVTLLQSLNRPFHVVTRRLVADDALRTAAVSPDGTLLAAGGDDDVVRLWDLRTGEPRGDPLSGHTDWVQGVAFSSDGTTLASVGHDGGVRLWDPATAAPRGGPLEGHVGPVSGLAFGPDPSLLATSGEDGTARLWDVTTGRQRGPAMAGQGEAFYGLALDPGGRRLATAGADGTLRLWDVASGRQSGPPVAGHEGWAVSVAFSPDGRALASAGADGWVRFWDASSLALLAEVETEQAGEISDIAFSPDGALLASAGRDGTVRLWDTATREAHGEPLTGHAGAVRSVAFTTDGESVVSASFDGSARVWQVATTFPGKRSLTGHEGRVTAVAASPHDPDLLVSAGADGTVRLWDTRTARPRGAPLRGHEGWVTAVAVSPVDDGLVASSGADGTVRLWDPASEGAPARTLRGHTGEVAGLAFSSDGSLLASGSRDGAVRLWRAADGEPLATLPGGAGGVLDVSFTDDGRRLAAGTEERTVLLWDVATRQPVGEPLTGHTGWVLGLDAGTDLLASGSGDGTVRLWDPATGRPVRTLTGHTHEVNDVSLSADGATVLSTGKDDTVRVWDVATGRPVGEPLSEPAQPVAVDVGRDGATVAVGRDDGVVELWDLRAETLVRLACATANRNLTRQEWAAMVGSGDPSVTCPEAVAAGTG